MSTCTWTLGFECISVSQKWVGNKSKLMVKISEREFAPKLVRAPNEVSNKDIKNETIGDTWS